MSGEGSDEILVGYQWQKDYEAPAKTWKSRLNTLLHPGETPYMLKYYENFMAMGVTTRLNYKNFYILTCTGTSIKIPSGNTRHFTNPNYRI